MPLKMYQEEAKAVPKNIIAIAAGKGGVGKSSIAVNLALALKKMGYSVGLMDTDIYGPSVRKMLPEDRMPTQIGERLIPALCGGIKMISLAYFRKENEAAVIRAPIANGIVTQFIQNVDWGDLDYLLVDFPPGTGDIQLTLAQQAKLTCAIMVTTPQEIAVMDVRKAIDLFNQVNVPILGVVENMSYYFHEKTEEKIYVFGKGGGSVLARECGVPFLGEIPLDPKLGQCADQGKSIFSEGEAISALSLMEFAANVEKQVKELKDTGKPFELIWKDEHNFTIKWADGKIQDFRLSDLQKMCPCANCVDEETGVRISNEKSVKEDVRAKRVMNVGRYAIRIDFTSGCSTGIYSFEMLKNLQKVSP